MDVPGNHPSLRPEEVFFSIDPDYLRGIEVREESEKIIGQPRALKALRLGTEIRAKGYNLFVSGQPGTGRNTAIRRVLMDLKGNNGNSQDIAYVFNFKQSDEPMVLYFAPGDARKFKQLLHELVEKLKILIKARLTSDIYKNRRDRIVSFIEKEENHILAEFEARLASQGFAAVRFEEGGGPSTDIVPLIDGSPGDFDQLQSKVASGELSEEEWNSRREVYYQLMDQMRAIFDDLKMARSAMEEDLSALQSETIKPSLHAELAQLKREFTDSRTAAYLESLERDILDHLFVFTGDEPIEDPAGGRVFLRYGVNILKEAGTHDTPPVIFENNPSVQNLIGIIEFPVDFAGRAAPNYTSIRAGSLIKASGGYLVIRLDDLLEEDGAWLQLKRVMQSEVVEIQQPQGIMGLPASQIKPEAVKVNVKVILVADEGAYDVLYNADVDFAKHFKVSAEFDSSMDLDSDGTARYMEFIRRKRAKQQSA